MSNKNQIEKNNPYEGYGSKAAFAQIFATVAESFLLIGLGLEISMPTIVINALYKNPDSEFSLTVTEVSWYGSILFIFHPSGSFLSGFLQERFGRKRCMIFANIPSIIGWLMLYFTHSTLLLYISTIMMGLSIGFSEAPILSYVGEITEPRLRGSMTSVASTLCMFGHLLTFILGFFFEWRTVALLSVLCPITCICLVMMIPESPIWLISKGKTEKAEKSLCWLRGWVKPETVKTEYLDLIHYNEVSEAQDGRVNSDDTFLMAFLSKVAKFKHPSVYRPLLLVMICFLISNAITIQPGKPFIGKIMTEVGIKDSQSLFLVIFGVMQIIGCVVVILTVHYFGKRFLILFSFSMNAALCLLFSIYIIMMKNGFFNTMVWIPITIISCIYFFGGFAIILPWMIISEIFPNKSRGIATGACAALSYLLTFILTKLFLPVVGILTLEYTIILYSGIGVFGVIYLYFFFPETENKSLLEIEEFFSLN